jgi:hypothetical protein
MKLLPIDTIPIKPTSDFQDFVNLYKKAKTESCQKSITSLLILLQSQFTLWDDLVKGKCFESDITLATLFHLVKIDTKPKYPFSKKINILFYHFEFYNISFKDLCIEAFLQHIKKETHVYKNYKNELKFFYYLSKELKSFLFKSLRKIFQLYKRDFTTNKSDYIKVNTYLDLYLDTAYLDKIKKTNLLLYSAYLFFLVNLDLSVYSLKTKFKLSLKQSKTLHEELCQLIKILPSSS